MNVLENLKKQASYTSGEGLGGVYTSLDEDEFARLIIEECCKVIDLLPNTSQLSSNIRKHFNCE